MEFESSVIADRSNHTDGSPKAKRPTTPTITVPDIYDLAASIGKDFETIIDRYGSDSVSNLMPKVIGVLEELECFAARFNSDDRELSTLQVAVSRLQAEKCQRSDDRSRSEKEVKQLEEMWMSESKELQQLIEHLKYENIRLKEAVKEIKEGREKCVNKQDFEDTVVEETHLMLRLKDIISKQKVELRKLNGQLAQKNIDLDAMQQQALRLAKINAVLRRKHFVSKRQVDQLTKERSELVSVLQSTDRLIEDEDCLRVFRLSSSCPDTPIVRCGMTVSLMNELASPDPPTDHRLSESQFIKRLNEENKMFTDNQIASEYSGSPQAKLPATIDDLRDLYSQRYELNSRLIEVDEELSVYARAGDYDSPVQGPINREPFDKLDTYHPRNSIIKSFFENLFKLNN